MKLQFHTPIYNLQTGEVFEDAKAVETWLRTTGTPSAQRGQIALCAQCNTNGATCYKRYGYSWIFHSS